MSKIKPMSEPLASRYDPAGEDAIYELWEKSGYFTPENCLKDGIADPAKEQFSIVLPPPNVTGTLHIGHAFEDTLQDIVVRYARMRGRPTLWVPGTDHAAIATQAKVEKILDKEEGISKHDLGREEFLSRVNKFALESHDTIVRQVRRMGASLDWTREAYTFDEQRNLAVRTAFKRMHDLGLIYRGNRIVNWDPKMQTTVSDDEIEYVEQTDPFYHFKYGPFDIGTVRPETKFGDKYVVMHPADERYKHFAHGQQIDLEWINGPITATIIKDEAADMEFGSGAMTITPAHSAIDFEIAQRHGLDIERVIDDRGILLPIAGEFAGMHIKKARLLIVEKLRAKGLVAKTEEKYLHNVATNSRGGGIIEPQIKEQWFVAVNKPFTFPHSTIPGIDSGSATTLKTIMRQAVESGAVKIAPERFEKIYFHWIDNLRDWCISRQLWFGHRVPVWYRGEEMYVGIEAPRGDGWEQDPDTLDTWFSSGTWSFSTLGWPEETDDLKKYHPNAFMDPGYEILFMWVARMILMSGCLLGQIPFRQVLLHGIVRDTQGRKFSKSLGNGVDPLELANQYGADALRMALVVGAAPGNDVKFSEDRVRGYRNFSTKIWNVARFVLINRPPVIPAILPFLKGVPPEAGRDLARIQYSGEDKKNLAELQELIKDTTAKVESYDFHLAAENLYHYFWHTFADKIVEQSKSRLMNASADAKAMADKAAAYKTLETILVTSLTLLHPFIPFVTEAVYQQIRQDSDPKLLMIARWPTGS